MWELAVQVLSPRPIPGSVERYALPPAWNRGPEAKRPDLGLDGSLRVGLAVDQEHMRPAVAEVAQPGEQLRLVRVS